ncbi:FAD-dependent oxidoreductase [Yoonia sp. 208BN28-4]|uniref:FAD-dependent oxidoreductase n=1 Tax=Yoonia sp. 208BN28-4 TaxID=3126505 RepID=UPI00309F545E
MTRHTIGIAGAGIGGLTIAALLADQGHEVTVFDQFDRPRPVGSGLVIQPVGQAVLAEIGALDDAMAKGNVVTHMLGHEADNGRRVLDVWYDRKAVPDRFGLAIHRASLFDAILKAAQRRDVTLQQSAQVAGRDGQHLTFADGSRAGPFDLTIDSCGAGSPLSPLKSYPLPYGAIWSTVDWPDTELPTTQLSQCYRRADRMIGALPIGTMPGEETPKAAIFWSLRRDGHAAWKAGGLEAWKDEATTLWPAFAPFAAQVTDPAQMTMARYSHGTLMKPYGRGIVHIGDAAHRASPQLGQGANMALLDALALARAMQRADLDDAPALYAKARRWHTRVYQVMSAVFTPQYQSDSKWLPVLRDRVLFPVSQINPLPKALTAIVCGTMLPPLASLHQDRNGLV